MTRAEWQAKRKPAAPGPTARELCRTEAERIAREAGVPLVLTRPERLMMFRRYGLPGPLMCRCNPFGLCPAGWYEGGKLRAVRGREPLALPPAGCSPTEELILMGRLEVVYA